MFRCYASHCVWLRMESGQGGMLSARCAGCMEAWGQSRNTFPVCLTINYSFNSLPMCMRSRIHFGAICSHTNMLKYSLL